MRRGELIERIDANYFLPSLAETAAKLEHSRYPKLALGDLVAEIVGGATPKLEDRKQYAERGVRFLRILNIGDGEIVEDDMKHIAENVHSGLLNRSQLRAGDVLMSITGRVGNAAIVPESILPANINQHLVAMRLEDARCSNAFLVEWLNSPTGLALTNREVSGGSRVALDYVRIRSLRIPLPPLAKQRELVDAMEVARAQTARKLTEADALLTGLDVYLLKTLGLATAPVRASGIFAIRRGNLMRLDPDFHSPRFRAIRQAIENGHNPVRSIAEICEYILTGFAAGKDDQAFDEDTGVPHLRPLNLNTFGELSLAGTKRVPREAVAEEDWCIRGEVLFNNTNSTEMVGKSAVFELSDACACSNHMTRLKVREGISPEFIAALFNALRSLGYLGLLSTNFNNQAGINMETLAALRLPIPDTSLQRSIAVEIRRRRERARVLRAEAEQDWAKAKRWFEEQLLGPAP